jgi:hypothetical protein
MLTICVIDLEATMPSRTTFLSKLIGLYLILIALSMVTHKQATVDIMTALIHNPPLLYVIGVIAVVAGLAMVLGHNVWSGGVFPLLVTLSGWLLLIKAMLLLFLPAEAVYGFLFAGTHFAQLFYLYSAVVLLLGLCLAYGGFRAAEQ